MTPFIKKLSTAPDGTESYRLTTSRNSKTRFELPAMLKVDWVIEDTVWDYEYSAGYARPTNRRNVEIMRYKAGYGVTVYGFSSDGQVDVCLNGHGYKRMPLAEVEVAWTPEVKAAFDRCQK